ncbi:TPA: hypothetical protein ACKOMP_000268 [Clostridioides difficile]
MYKQRKEASKKLLIYTIILLYKKPKYTLVVANTIAINSDINAIY